MGLSLTMFGAHSLHMYLICDLIHFIMKASCKESDMMLDIKKLIVLFCHTLRVSGTAIIFYLQIRLGLIHYRYIILIIGIFQFFTFELPFFCRVMDLVWDICLSYC